VTKRAIGCVRVRALRAVLAPIGSELLVSRQEAAALVAMGNAEICGAEPAETGTYNRRDMVAEGTNGAPRKTRH